MRTHWARLLVALAACSDTDLYLPTKEEPPPPEVGPNQLKGTICPDEPKTITFPTRVWFIIDDSGSMRRADPNQRRYAAVRELATRLAKPGLMSFGGERFYDDAVRFSFPRFTDNVPLFNMQVPVSEGGGATNYMAALTLAYNELSADVTENNLVAKRSRYVVIFLSDGEPNPAVPEPTILGAVDQLMSLKPRVGGIVLNTVWLGGPGVGETLLRNMARRGGGTLKSFPNGDALDYSGFDFATVLRTYTHRYFFATNRSMAPWEGGQAVDSDADGLPDAFEVQTLKTDPLVRDTDGDGCSDLMERRMMWNPLVKGGAGQCTCVASELGDSDKDGLSDCEESWLSTLNGEPDSDGDRVPDGLDYVYLHDAKFPNETADHDVDGVLDLEELEAHTNARGNDDAQDRARWAYRYPLFRELADRPQCYDFSVDNVALGRTLKTADHEADENIIELYMAQSPNDNPDVDRSFRIARLKVPYAEAGLSLAVTPNDFSIVLKGSAQ